MKLAKSLLLGSAAGLVAVAGAQGADLPVKKAVAVEYVRVCSAFGTGFFYIPGSTDTCIRLSGRVRAEFLAVDAQTRGEDATGFRARGRINVDARTQTAYGTLRTFIRYDITRNTGTYFPTASNVNGNPATNVNSTVDLNSAFVQFAGITAGRAQSMFDFYANDLNWGGSYGTDQKSNMFAYTATLGSGLSATLSVEDPADRRRVPSTLAGPGTAIAFAGQRMPEIVGNVRYDGAFGSAQLSAAVHEVKGLNVVPNLFAGNAVPGAGTFVDTEYGFAVQGGLKINAPQIAPGDVLWLQAAYAEGASNYLGLGGNLSQGRVNAPVGDAIVNAFGDTKLVRGTSFTAAFLHYWTPEIRQAIHGTVNTVDFSRTVETANLTTGAFAGRAGPVNSIRDLTFFAVGSNLIYSPVRDLDIGVEVLYRSVDVRGRVIDATAANRTVSEQGILEGRLRIQRDF